MKFNLLCWWKTKIGLVNISKETKKIINLDFISDYFYAICSHPFLFMENLFLTANSKIQHKQLLQTHTNVMIYGK